MTQLDKRYWLLIPAGIFTGIVSVIAIYIMETANDHPPLFLIPFVVYCGLPFLSAGLVFNKIYPKQNLFTIGGVGIFVTLFSIAGGTFAFILTSWLDFFIISACIGSGIGMMIMRSYIIRNYPVTNDSLAKLTTFLAGLIGGAVSLAFYGEWIPRRIMGDFPLNLMVGYTVFILFFYSTFILSELKENRKMIVFWFFLIFSSLLFDIFSRGLLINLSEVTSKWI